MSAMNFRLVRLMLAGSVAMMIWSGTTAQAATYTWNQTAAGPFDWNDAAKWLPNTAFPNAMDDVALLTNTLSAAQTINLNTGITIGTLRIWTPIAKLFTISSNNVNGALTFSATGAGATLAHASMGSGTINALNTISAPITLSSDTLFDMYGVSAHGLNQYDGNYWMFGLALNGVIAGSGNFTKAGPDALWLGNTANTFLGNIAIRQGYLFPANLGGGLGNAANAITLGSTGTIGHIVSQNASVGLTRQLALSGAGGGLHPYANFGIGTNITGSGLLLLGKGNGQMYFSNTVDNTYVGDARVHCGYVDARVAKRLFTGNVTVQYCGYLRLLDANNVGGTVRVDSVSMPTPILNVPAILGLKGNDFFPRLDTNSSGILSLESNSTAAVEAALAVGAAQLGNGYMHYGSRDYCTFYGASLQPNLDHVFRFTIPYGSGALTLDRGGSTAGVLTDVGGVPHAVEINAWPTANDVFNLITVDANDFSGPLTINPAARFIGTPLTSGSPFGAGGGTVNLNAGILYVSAAPSGAAVMSKGALNLQGQCNISFNSPSYTASLTFDTVTRSNRAILAVYASGSPPTNLGGTELLYITNGVPTPTNGMVPPWLIAGGWQMTNRFLNYDTGAKLFTNTAFTSTDLATAGATDIVNLVSGGTVPVGGTNIYALRTAGVLAGAAGDTLTIASGGLILDSSGANNTFPNAMNHTADINFGNAEGVIWISGFNGLYHCNQLSGRISGSNGLTIGGPIYGNHAPVLYITNDNTATLTGQITINEGRVLVTSTALGNTNNMIYLNSCGVPATSDSRVASLGPAVGDVTITNPITLGPNGGVLENAGAYLTLKGKISGPGGLAVYDGDQSYLYLNNPGNDWAGGTWVFGTSLKVLSGSKLGPGDVIVGGCTGRLFLDDTNAIAPTARVALITSLTKNSEGVYITCASATWGSLEGNGVVLMNKGAAPVLLTIGGNNASTEFHGQIKDSSMWTSGYGCFGSLTKVGTGIFSLYGEVLLAGTTTVARGAMVVNGLVNCSKTIVDGAAGAAVLSGNGLIASTVAVTNGGTLAPSAAGKGVLTVNGNVMFDAASAWQVTLGGTNAAVDFGQLSVRGAIELNGAALNITLTSVPPISQQYMIMNNPAGATVGSTRFASGHKVSGTYLGKTYWFRIDYQGGDGNDIVLTCIPSGSVFSFH